MSRIARELKVRSQIIYATLLEFVVDGKVPAAKQAMGCVLIVGASLYGRG